MKSPEDFIENLPNPQLRETARFLHGFICSYPGIRSALKYGIPFYTGRSGICYLNPTRDGQLEWAFIKGYRMENASGVLQSRGRKQVTGVLLRSIADLDEETLEALMTEALTMDEKKRDRLNP